MKRGGCYLAAAKRSLDPLPHLYFAKSALRGRKKKERVGAFWRLGPLVAPHLYTLLGSKGTGILCRICS